MRGGGFAVFVLVIIAVATLLYFLGWHNYVSRVSRFEELENVRVVDVKFSIAEPPEYECRLDINLTHVTYVCWGERVIYEIWLENDKGEFWTANLWVRVNHTRIEVANLINKTYVAYDIVNLTKWGYGVVKLVDREGTFEYVWADLLFYPRLDGVSLVDAYDPESNSVKFYIAVFTYVDKVCGDYVCNLTYLPAPMEISYELAKAGELTWCKPFELFLGINCSFIPVNPEEYCSWQEKVMMKFSGYRGHGAIKWYNINYSKFNCRKINNLDVIRVILMPASFPTKWGQAWGYCYRGKWILMFYRNLTFIHEIGHSIGLDHPKPEVVRFKVLRWKPYAEQLIKETVMLRKRFLYPIKYRRISFADAVWSLLLVVRNKSRYLDKFLSYGINPFNSTVLLPIDMERYDIPPPFSSIIEEGLVTVKYHAIYYTYNLTINYNLLKLMKTITSVGNNTTQYIHYRANT